MRDIIDLNELRQPPTAVTIRTGTRAIQLRDISGVMIHCEPGTLITISAGTLAELGPSDFTIVGRVDPGIDDHRGA